MRDLRPRSRCATPTKATRLMRHGSALRDEICWKRRLPGTAQIEAQPLVAPYANSVNHCVAETVEYTSGSVAQQAEVDAGLNRMKRAIRRR